MRQPKTNLKQALENTNGHSPPEPVKVDAQPKPKSQPCPSRRGKKPVIGYFDKAAHLQLKMLALEKETSIQNLLADALNMLFKVHDKPPIA